MSRTRVAATAPTLRRRRWLHRIVTLALILSGAAVSARPVGQTYLNNQQATTSLIGYGQGVTASRPDVLDAELRRAEVYNTTLGPLALHDPWTGNSSTGTSTHADYLSQLSRQPQPGVMGRLRIPRIQVDLPILHDADPDSLARGVGHMFGSSLPVGGPGTNAVLAAHTGHPGRTFFDRLPELADGDLFTLKVDGRTLTYRIDQQRVVAPSDVDAVRPVRDEDHVTLVTCVGGLAVGPRLLVRGTRVGPPIPAALTPAQSAEVVTWDDSVQPWMKPRLLLTGGALGLTAALLAGWSITDLRRLRRARRANPAAPSTRTTAGRDSARVRVTDVHRDTVSRTPTESKDNNE